MPSPRRWYQQPPVGLLGWLIAVFGLLILPISRKLEREHQHEDVSAIERAT